MLNGKEGEGDILNGDYINSLGQLYAAFLGTHWPVWDICIETGLMRIDVCGKLEVKRLEDVSFFLDDAGNKHFPEDFYLEKDNEDE